MPGVKFVNEQLSDVAGDGVHVAPPGDAVTTYPVTAAPAVGADHVTSTEVTPGVTSIPVGALGVFWGDTTELALLDSPDPL